MNSNLHNKSPYQGSQVLQDNYNNSNSNPAFKNQPGYSPRQQKKKREQNKPNNQQNQGKQQTPLNPNEQSIRNYCISIALFLIAFLVFGIVWGIEKILLNHEVSSHYYLKSYAWSYAYPTVFKIPINASLIGLSLAVVFEWMMWKIPLIVFTYNCIRLRQGKFKLVTFIVTIVILLAVDASMHLFLLDLYNSYMYFGFYTLLSVIVVLMNNGVLDRKKIAFVDCFLPLLYIGIVHGIQVIGLPILYKLYTKYLDTSSSLFMVFYLFPIFDIIMYALLLFIGTYLSAQVKIFHQQLHFLTLGYAVGMIMLVGYTQVEFYYLIAYYIFRNVFCNYVMYKWDTILNLPPALPLWIIPYFFSYVLLFMPFGGVGNIVTSIGYYSLLLVNTSPQLYYLPNSMYPNSLFTPLIDLPLNIEFNGDIFWLAAPIIWLGLTFSQKYNKKRPQIVYTLFYNMFGIYLFYLGLSSALVSNSLTDNSII